MTLDNVPLYLLKVWLCVKNSYLRKRINDETPENQYPSRETVIARFGEIMSQPIKWEEENATEKRTETPQTAVGYVVLPPSMTREEVEADLLSIFDACVKGRYYEKFSPYNTYFFEKHNNRTAKEDFEYLTSASLLVYNLVTKKFEKAEVQPLWEYDGWHRWVNCR